MVKVAIVEDIKQIREGLAYLIDSARELSVIGSFESAEDFLDSLKDTVPDIVLMDIQLPGMDGIEATALIKDLHSNVEVMMLTIFEDEEKIFKSIKAGATGYVLKDTPKRTLIQEILELSNGGSPMTPRIARKVLLELKPDKVRKKSYNLSDREKEILKHIVSGSTYHTIADDLDISPNTVRKHIQNIYQKLKVSSKAEVVGKAINEDLV
ncbi:MAG: response regulator transcription factor [Spirochaetota bacterium]|nr:response regulator transcription factor [Spirochaetota bacterium]